MSTIRRQSIISSAVVYLGFGVGGLNTLLYAKWLTAGEYGLIGMFVSLGTIMYFIANLGMPIFVGKFYPYYHDNLAPNKNDMMTWAILVSLAGFGMVTIAGVFLKPVVIRKFGHNSADLIHYYYWIFPFGLGMTLFSLLEAYGWQLKRAVTTSFFREVLLRLITLLLLFLLFLGFIHGFDKFIKLYSFLYLLLSAILFGLLMRSGQLHLVLTPSRVTRKFFSRVRRMALMSWSGNLFYNIAFFFGQIVIAAVVPGGLSAVGVYVLAQYSASLIQAPQRGIIAASIGPLSRAWKDKDMARIQRIYARSSINQLIFSLGLFLLILLNFRDGIITFHLKPEYLGGFFVFLFIGLTRILDMGTGVNTQIIGTSLYWRIDLYTGLILAIATLPLNYILAKAYGIVGPAIADLLTFFFYNFIRWAFLYRKFGLQPFGWNTLLAVVLGGSAYFVCWLAFDHQQGLIWMVARSLVFLGVFVSGVLVLRLSEDVIPVWDTVKKKLGLNRKG